MPDLSDEDLDRLSVTTEEDQEVAEEWFAGMEATGEEVQAPELLEAEEETE